MHVVAFKAAWTEFITYKYEFLVVCVKYELQYLFVNQAIFPWDFDIRYLYLIKKNHNSRVSRLFAPYYDSPPASRWM